MDSIELLRLSFREVHEAIDDDVAALDADTVFFQPVPEANHIGFLLWHLVRDEDVVVGLVAREPTLWDSSDWRERLGMDEKGQGTGFESELLPTLRFELNDLMAYARAVWAATDERLQKLSPDDLDAPTPGYDQMSIASQLTTGSLAHNWVHLGEIRYILGLRGWRFRE